jgi:hypothetical protein
MVLAFLFEATAISFCNSTLLPVVSKGTFFGSVSDAVGIEKNSKEIFFQRSESSAVETTKSCGLTITTTVVKQNCEEK